MAGKTERKMNRHDGATCAAMLGTLLIICAASCGALVGCTLQAAKNSHRLPLGFRVIAWNTATNVWSFDATTLGWSSGAPVRHRLDAVCVMTEWPAAKKSELNVCDLQVGQWMADSDDGAFHASVADKILTVESDNKDGSSVRETFRIVHDAEIGPLRGPEPE